MKKSQFTQARLVTIEADVDRGEKTIRDVCRADGVYQAVSAIAGPIR